MATDHETGDDDRRSAAPWLALLAILLAIGGAYYWFVYRHSEPAPAAQPTASAEAPATAQAQAAEPPPAPAPSNCPGKVFEKDVHFAFDSVAYQKPRRAHETADEIIRSAAAEYQQRLKNHAAGCETIINIVVAHADAVGTEAYNLELSQRRSAKVQAALTSAIESLGAGAPTVSACHVGEDDLLVQTVSRSLANRRAMITIEVLPQGDPGDESARCPTAAGGHTP